MKTETTNRIHNLSKIQCGRCDHWMKSSCLPEKERGLFCSISTPGCKMFSRDSFTTNLIADLQNETTPAGARVAGADDQC